MSDVTVSFGHEQEVALARSACRRLLATTHVHLSSAQRAAVEAVLADLGGIGMDYGRWQVRLGPELLQALHFAVDRQRHLMVLRGENGGPGTALAAAVRVAGRLHVPDGGEAAER